MSAPAARGKTGSSSSRKAARLSAPTRPLTARPSWKTTKVGTDYLKMAAAGVVASAPPVLLALVFQRFLIRGLTEGAVKG